MVAGSAAAISVVPQLEIPSATPYSAARRYLFVAIDRATRWVYLRIYGDQGERSSTDFLRRLHAEAPMKIVKVLTDDGSQFTDRFTGKNKQSTGEHGVGRPMNKKQGAVRIE